MYIVLLACIIDTQTNESFMVANGASRVPRNLIKVDLVITHVIFTDYF